jgi:hypothetical protein
LLWAYPQAGSEETVAEGCLATDLALLYQYLKPKLASPDSDLARAWSKFIWVQGDSLTNAMTAVHEALHDSDLFDGGTDDERSTDNDSPGQTGAT